MALRILFVCLGNICRSPLAEIALRDEAAHRGLSIDVDSAGTGDWHVGDPPDPRTIAVARRNGTDASHLRARQVSVEDFYRFDRIVAMDRRNRDDLAALAPDDATADLVLALDLVDGREGEGVHDPYHDGAAAFDATWNDATLIARAIADGVAAQPSG